MNKISIRTVKLAFSKAGAAAPAELGYIAKAQEVPRVTGIFQTKVIKNGGLHTVTITLVGDKSSGTFNRGTDHDMTLGAGVATGKTDEDQVKQIAAMLFHELVHIEVFIGDANSGFVSRFATFKVNAKAKIDALQRSGDVDTFVRECKNIFFQNSTILRDSDATALAGDLLPFLTNEAFTYGEEQSAFPKVVPRTLAEHIRHDLEGKMQAVYEKLCLNQRGITFVAARGSPGSAMNRQMDTFAAKVVAAMP